jgi:hypothetical protein
VPPLYWHLPSLDDASWCTLSVVAENLSLLLLFFHSVRLSTTCKHQLLCEIATLLAAGTHPVFFFVGQQAEGLLAAAQAGLQLANITNVLIDIDADVAMQYSPISTMGPVSSLLRLISGTV